MCIFKSFIRWIASVRYIILPLYLRSKHKWKVNGKVRARKECPNGKIQLEEYDLNSAGGSGLCTRVIMYTDIHKLTSMHVLCSKHTHICRRVIVVLDDCSENRVFSSMYFRYWWTIHERQAKCNTCFVSYPFIVKFFFQLYTSIQYEKATDFSDTFRFNSQTYVWRSTHRWFTWA